MTSEPFKIWPVPEKPTGTQKELAWDHPQVGKQPKHAHKLDVVLLIGGNPYAGLKTQIGAVSALIAAKQYGSVCVGVELFNYLRMNKQLEGKRWTTEDKFFYRIYDK